MKVVAYMVIEIGLALLALVGFAAGPLLLWPRWLLSPVARESMMGGALVAALFLLSCLVYAGHTLRWPLIRWVPMAKLAGPAIVPLALALGVLYFWPVSMLPAPDPTSPNMLSLGPSDEVQMTLWTWFTLFGYVPLAIASLFWHFLTMFVMWTHDKRVRAAEPMPAKVETVLTVEGAKTR